MRALSFAKDFRKAMVRVLVGLVHLADVVQFGVPSEPARLAARFQGMAGLVPALTSAKQRDVLWMEIYSKTVDSVCFMINDKLGATQPQMTSLRCLELLQFPGFTLSPEPLMRNHVANMLHGLYAWTMLTSLQTELAAEGVGSRACDALVQPTLHPSIAPLVLRKHEVLSEALWTEAAASSEFSVAALFAERNSAARGSGAPKNATLSVLSQWASSVAADDLWFVLGLHRQDSAVSVAQQLQALQLVACDQLRREPSVCLEMAAFYVQFRILR
jgi:hypothetical protein